jgi:alkaline phosphatase
MGGGNRHFDAEMRDDGRDLYGEFEEAGYTVVKNKRQLGMATRNSKLLGIFYDSHLPYSIDHETLPELRDTIPTVAEMTTAALERLSQNENGFLLQVEGARVDHAAHGNDAAGMIYDQIAFDDAVGAVMEFTKNRDDTLVILTTDHGNANPGVSGMGSSYSSTPDLFETLHDYRHSFEWMMRELYGQSVPTVNRVRELVEYATRTQITAEEAVMVQKAVQGEFDAPFNMRESAGAVLSGVLANYNSVYFMTTNHTSDYVELAAWGPGSDRLDSFVRNTDLFDLMVDMADVRAYAQG